MKIIITENQYDKLILEYESSDIDLPKVFVEKEKFYETKVEYDLAMLSYLRLKRMEKTEHENLKLFNGFPKSGNHISLLFNDCTKNLTQGKIIDKRLDDKMKEIANKNKNYPLYEKEKKYVFSTLDKTRSGTEPIFHCVSYDKTKNITSYFSKKNKNEIPVDKEHFSYDTRKTRNPTTIIKPIFKEKEQNNFDVSPKSKNEKPQISNKTKTTIKPVKPKEEPIVPVTSTIEPKKETTVRDAETGPVYGPARSLIGHMHESGTFVPLPTHWSMNKPDRELLANKEALNKYLYSLYGAYVKKVQ